jgi:hypothetical protein
MDDDERPELGFLVAEVRNSRERLHSLIIEITGTDEQTKPRGPELDRLAAQVEVSRMRLRFLSSARLRGGRMLFGCAFQAPQRDRWSGDELSSEESLDKPSPPTWREDEASGECDAARVSVDGYDVDLLVACYTKGQPDIERELPPWIHLEHIKGNAQHAGSNDEMIARDH